MMKGFWIGLVLAGATSGTRAAEPVQAPPIQSEAAAEVTEAAAGETVKLTFAWKPGLQFTASSTAVKERTGKPAQSLAMQYGVRVEAAKEHLQIRFVDLKIGAAKTGDTVAPEINSEQITSVVLPDLIVTHEGEMVELANLQQVQAGVRALIDKQMKDRGHGAMADKVTAMVTRPEFLTMQASEWWTPVVESWAGGELEVGETYEFQQEAPMPIIPGAQILMRGEFQIKALEPCMRGKTGRTCAVIEMRMVPDPDDLLRLIRKFVAEMASGKEAAFDKFSLDMQILLTVRTEPDGLFPHYVRSEKRIEVSDASKAKPETQSQREVRETSFTYP